MVSNRPAGAVSLSAALCGANPSQFAISAAGTTCGSLLAVSSNCLYAVTFKPKSKRSYAATLKIKASPDPASPHSVALGGNGV